MSSALSPSDILKNPEHCSYATFPNFGTFNNCFLFLNFPFSSLYFTMFFAIPEFTPDTYDSSDGVAIFTSTPTLFTASSTTPVRLSFNVFWFTSC